MLTLGSRSLTNFLMERSRTINLLQKEIVKIIQEKHSILAQRKWNKATRLHLLAYDGQIERLKDRIEALQSQITYSIETGEY